MIRQRWRSIIRSASARWASLVAVLVVVAVLGAIGALQEKPPSGLPTLDPEVDWPLPGPTPVSDSEVPLPPGLPAIGGPWVSQGPGPTNFGQSEGITNNPVVGSVQAIVAHPANADIVWIGAVNGGVWKTTNATSASPTWTPQTDAFSSLSIGALQRDPTDGTSNTLVAGFGRFSSFGSGGGPRTGVLRTTNGGTLWTAPTSTGLSGKNITGIAGRGAVIVVSVNQDDPNTCAGIGIFRSLDTGATFTRISGGASGLPQGSSFDLASDPTNNAVFYTTVRFAGAQCGSGGVNGVYKSTDTGATWAKVSSPAMDALIATDATFGNARIAVGQSGEVYAGLIVSGRMGGLFRSGPGGTSWVQLDTPVTNENGSIIGLQPIEESGGQGNTHFSIVADPNNPNVVYLGGDRQPGAGDGATTWPNSLGAINYSGRLFRVNAAAAPGSQATPLTHCQTATAACNNTVSTLSKSSPHADSRRLVFDAAGNLLEADDGGLYRRTNPSGTGDWFSVNGSLRVTEQHDIAYDTVSNMIISGNQDTGTSEQTSVGGTVWNQVSQADGGDVSVDDIGSPTQSIRYSSYQNLQSFRRRIVNASGTTTSTAFPARTVIGGGAAFSAPFVTPVEINTIDPTRLLLAGSNFLYESLDRGDTITALTGFNRAATAMVYGGKSGGVNNIDLIYAISTSGLNANGPNVFVRTAGGGAPAQTATSPGIATLRDVAVNPNNWQNAFVVSSAGKVFSTPNTGATWTEITGDLGNGTTDLRTVVFMSGTNSIAVGGLYGVFVMAVGNPGVWNQLGTGMSNAVVWDLDYDPTDDVLVAGTLGRGAWRYGSADAPTISTITNKGVRQDTSTPAIPFSVGDSATPPGSLVVTGVSSNTTVVPNGNISLGGSGGSRTVTLTPAAGQSGTVSITLTVSDGSFQTATSFQLRVVGFTDNVITVATTPIKRVHVIELRAAIDQLRLDVGLGAFAWADATITVGSTQVRGQHIADLRTAVTQAYTQTGRAGPTFTDGTLVTGATPVRRVHIEEIRNALIALLALL